MQQQRTGENEKAHDVLAAEEFAMPSLDPTLHHAPVKLPADPSGVAEPHDVLAAEEFAIPAPRPTWSGGIVRNQPPSLATPIATALGGLLLLMLVRRRIRRR
jgi:hypothetical protein